MTAPPAIHDLREAVAHKTPPAPETLRKPVSEDIADLLLEGDAVTPYAFACHLLRGDGPIASEHARLTDERDAAREDHIRAEAHICALEVLAYIEPEHTWKDAAIKERVARLAAEAELTPLKQEREAAAQLAGLTWTAPDIDAVGRWAEEKGAAGTRDKMNRLFRRAATAEERVRQLLNEADRVGQESPDQYERERDEALDELTTLKAAAARDAEVIARMREALVRIRDFAGASFLVRSDALFIVHQYAARAILTSPENADV